MNLLEPIMILKIIIIIIAIHLNSYFGKVLEKASEAIIFRKNGKEIDFPLIKRALKIKSGITVSNEVGALGPRTNIRTKTLFVNKFKHRDLNWFSILSHEVGHCILHSKISMQIYFANLPMVLLLFIWLVVIICLKLSIYFVFPSFLIFGLTISNMFLKEIQASIFGYRLLCRTFVLGKKEKYAIKKFYLSAFMTYVTMIVMLVAILSIFM